MKIIYVLSNPSMPGIVKIGKTTQKGVKDRMRQLYSTGVPVPFKCEYACTVKDCDDVEKRLHNGLQKYRLHEGREFFEIEAEDVIQLLGMAAIEDVTPVIESVIEADTTPEEKDTVNKIRKKRPNINFYDLDIPEGSILKFLKNGEEEVRVCSENKVIYKDEERSLTSVTKQLLGVERAVAPAPRWYFEGRRLRDIYNEYHSE